MKDNLLLAALCIGVAWPFVSAADDHASFADEMPVEASRKGALAAAIRVAEASMNGRAFEAELDRDNGAYVFEVSTRSAADVHELSISLSGEILEDEDEGLLGRLFSQAPGILDIAERSLIEAITAVEAQIDGFAYAAELEFENGQPIYEIEAMTSDGVLLEARVDGMSGKVVSVNGEDD